MVVEENKLNDDSTEKGTEFIQEESVISEDVIANDSESNNDEIIHLEINLESDDNEILESDYKNIINYSEFSKDELVTALNELLNIGDISKIKNEVETIRSIFYKKNRVEIEDLKAKFLESGGDIKDFKPQESSAEETFKELYKKFKEKRFELTKKQEAEKEENLKKKYQIIEDIKELVNKEESINKTFNDFRELQLQWKEIGAVPQSEQKNLWETYHLHIENFYNYVNINKELRDLDLKKNLDKKIELCEKAEDLLLEKNIKKAIDKLQEYHEIWREIGPIPNDKKDEIWERFKHTTSQINKNHQDYIVTLRKEQENNFEAKKALCEKVEEIAEKNIESNKEWDEETQKIIDIQNIWKTIGFGPKKYNNDIYFRFREACNLFFNKKKEFYKVINDELNTNLQKKIDLCLVAESLKESQDWKETTFELIKLQKQWKTIGQIPRNKSEQIWKRFRSACDYFFTQKEEYYKSFDKIQEENYNKKLSLIKEIQAYSLDSDSKIALEELKKYQKQWSEIGFVPENKKAEIQTCYREAINAHFNNLNIDDKKKDMILFKQKVETLNDSKSKKKIDDEREKIALKVKNLESEIALLENNIGFFSNSKKSESLVADFKLKIETSKKELSELKEKLKIIDQQ
ncbi:MAG TPA: DUF349 domain-containing protein [Bacteroidales bacterium]|nr:MAG: hypothetical protein A2W98_02635 [Bacteroidetes bacterium GWF2_33_38]HBF87636.1 DUF349 domain-containing protein [Bacteroidales bacterium]